MKDRLPWAHASKVQVSALRAYGVMVMPKVKGDLLGLTLWWGGWMYELRLGTYGQVQALKAEIARRKAIPQAERDKMLREVDLRVMLGSLTTDERKVALELLQRKGDEG